MKKMSMAVGSLVFLGFIFIMCGMILKFSGLNLLDPLIRSIASYFLAANTCFLTALIISWFDKPTE